MANDLLNAFRQWLRTPVNREPLMAWMAALFFVLGLAMAVIGLYGTFTHAVARRRASRIDPITALREE